MTPITCSPGRFRISFQSTCAWRRSSSSYLCSACCASGPDPCSTTGCATDSATSSPDEFELRKQFRFLFTCLIVFIALCAAGHTKEPVLLWWLPSRIGFFIVTAVFASLPHFPHDERGRYRDTRVTLFALSKAICRGQDRLPKLFDEKRPILEAIDVRVEGRLAGKGASPVRLRFRPPEKQPKPASSA